MSSAQPNLKIRLRLETPSGTVSARPDERSPELDSLLDEMGAETLVLLPLFKPDCKTKKRTKRLKKLGKLREKLKEGEWHGGEVEAGAFPWTPAAWQFDLRRIDARAIGEELGVDEFYWACRGMPLEAHKVEPLSDDDPDTESIQEEARAGLKDLLHTALELEHLQAATRAVGSSNARLLSAAVLVLGISAAVFALYLLGVLPFESSALQGFGNVLSVLAHPLLLPSLIMGLYLRPHFRQYRRASSTDRFRELTREEAAEKWRETAPHLLAVWAILLAGVLLLTTAKLIAENQLSLIEFVDEGSHYYLIALWVLAPLSYSQNTAAAVGPWIEAAVAAFISIIVLKISLFVANMASGFIVGILTGFLPFEFSESATTLFENTTSFVAQLGFAALLVGYTWNKTCTQFCRWATVKIEGAEPSGT